MANPHASPLITLDHVSVSIGTARILRDISWSLHNGQHWFISGPNGAGKSTFLRLLYGDVHPDPDGRGRRTYYFGGQISRSPVGVRKHISLVTPGLQEAYWRYGWDVSGYEAVLSGLTAGVWLYEKPTPEHVRTADLLFERLGIRHLRDKTVLEMSQGEMRKVLIARALILQPSVLLFDDFCSGLDLFSRMTVLDTICQIAASGVHVIFAANRDEEASSFLTHQLRLNEGRIISWGKRPSSSHPRTTRDTGDVHASPRDFASRRSINARATIPSKSANSQPSESLGLEDCDVYLGGTRVLRSITWRVMEGENWLIMGRNGSGKSTLVKLITCDLYPAYGGKVRRFGSDKPQSVWEIRRRIGLVSPEIQASFPSSSLGYEVIQSGFFSSIGMYHELDEGQQKTMEEWVELLELQRLCSSPIAHLSYGEMRKLLITRSLINKPSMLILDEPCTGLDGSTKDEILKMIDYLGTTRLQVILVTHQMDEIIPCISHAMILHKGAIAAQGKFTQAITSDTISRFLLEDVDGDDDVMSPDEFGSRP